MEAYVMDAFTSRVFGGNQAGVVLPDRPLTDEQMQQIAAEFKHSETAFATLCPDGSVNLKYFTPAGEVDLCGHATVGTFALLRELGRIGSGEVTAHTRAGDLRLELAGDMVWMDMAPPRFLRELTAEEQEALYRAYGLTPEDGVAGLTPAIVSTGLPDVLMPVASHELLMAARQDESAVTELSRRWGCVGVHMFCPGAGDVTAWCSNFAPLYAIPEECATGTSNGALTYYLYRNGQLRPGGENRFVQGEHMGRPAEIRSRLIGSGDDVLVRVGGQAVMSMACDLKI